MKVKVTKEHANPAPAFLVQNPTTLLPILKERLPQSCFIYNQVISSHKLKTDLKFYILSSEINSDSWIVSDYIREDYGHNISISAPTEIIHGTCEIPLEVKECFASSHIINWDEGLVFVALEKAVSAMIFDVSTNINGNITKAHPCILFYMERKDALNLPIRPGPEAKIHRLDPKADSDFVISAWKFSREGTRNVVSRCIASNASAGVFVDGICASCAIIMGDGLLHCLHTRREYRKRGYARLTMNFAFKEFAKDGCIPCSTVEVKNGPSIAFHESLGVKTISTVDYLHVETLVMD